jgi:hypothetical protein
MASQKGFGREAEPTQPIVNQVVRDLPIAAGSEDALPEAARPARASAEAVPPGDGGEAASGRAGRRDDEPTPKRRRLRLETKDSPPCTTSQPPKRPFPERWST